MNHDNDNDNGLRFLSVCSGIEAASVAWGPLGWRAVAFGEIDKNASALLAYRYPDVPNLGDFTKIDAATLGRVDILCGGTPCQAFSVAGARRGLDDERGNLSLEFVRLAHELADSNGLRNAIWENVPGVLTMSDNAFGCFLAGIVGADGPFVPVERKPAEGRSTRWWRWSEKEKVHAVCWPSYGMVSGPKGRAAWAVKDAQFFGLAQRRERVLVVADFGNGADPAAVLFERVGVPWNPPARGEKGEDVAGTVTASTGGVSGKDDIDGRVTAVLRGISDYGAGLPALRAKGGDCAGGSEAFVFAPEIARCDATREGSSQDYESTTMVAVHAIQAGALRENPNSGPDGVGVQADVAYTIEARAEVQAVCVTGTVTHTLTTEGADASEDGTGRGTPIIAFAQNQRDEVREMDIAGALAAEPGMNASGGYMVPTTTSAVRRLTPRECERLQGFPDDYTLIPVRKYATKKVTKNRPDDMWSLIDGELWLMAADGPRYKQLGNSWAVPKFRWLGERIQRLMPKSAANDNQGLRRAA